MPAPGTPSGAASARMESAIEANDDESSRHIPSGSSRCASKPAEMSTSCGSNARAAGTTTGGTSDSQTPSPDPDGTGRLIEYPAPSPDPTSVSGPVPGYHGY